jgi:hypothetical protein
MYSNIEEAWKSSNDLDKYRKDFHPVTRVSNATNEVNDMNHNSSKSSRFLDEKMNSSSEQKHKSRAASPQFIASSDILSDVSEIENVRQLINKPSKSMKQKPSINKKQLPANNQKMKKVQKNKPVILINNKKHLDRNKSINVSSQSHFDFETDLRDLPGSLKKDDGTQCNKLFSHFQVCKKCRTTLLEKFTNNAGPAIRELSEIGQQNSIDSFKNITESFVDLSKYTDLLKDKNNKNILSIILFGLLVIIILSMIYT